MLLSEIIIILLYLIYKAIQKNSIFSSNNIYYLDEMKYDVYIVNIKLGDEWKMIGIPYIVLYKKFKKIINIYNEF